MKSLIALFIVALAFIYKVNGQLLIGKPLPDSVVVISNVTTQTTVNGFTPGKIIKYRHIEYIIVLDTNSLVINVKTFDKNFVTEEGVRVGMMYKQIAAREKNKKFINGLGYEFYLKSGWVALFTDPQIFKTKKLTNSSRVKSIYMPSIIH